jgi:glutamyl-tRNA synthetase
VARHREVAEQMLASGHAYRCYASPDELTAMREKARAEGKTRLWQPLARPRPGDAAGSSPRSGSRRR